jgi:hypothetical protein
VTPTGTRLATKNKNMPPKKFIAKALEGGAKKGVLRARAAKEGALTSSGTISVAWLRRVAKEPGVWGRRARFALTLRRLH